MTDLDTLQRALRASEEAGGLDVTVIIARGRKLRWRRRLVAVGGGLCVAAALAAVAAGAPHLARPALTPGQRPAAPGQSVPATKPIAPPRHPATVTPSPSRDQRAPVPAPTAHPTPVASAGARNPAASPGTGAPTPVPTMTRPAATRVTVTATPTTAPTAGRPSATSTARARPAATPTP